MFQQKMDIVFESVNFSCGFDYVFSRSSNEDIVLLQLRMDGLQCCILLGTIPLNLLCEFVPIDHTSELLLNSIIDSRV